MKLTVETTDRLDRLDKFLTAKLSSATRSFVQKQIKCGAVTVNGSPTNAHYKPKPGDVIEIAKVEQEAASIVPDASVAFKVIDEQPDFLVVEKPAGLVVHPALGVSEPTLADGLAAKYPELTEVGEDKLRHRQYQKNCRQNEYDLPHISPPPPSAAGTQLIGNSQARAIRRSRSIPTGNSRSPARPTPNRP